MEQTPVPSLHTDKYQINMMYAHWKNGTHLRRRAFDLYFRSSPSETVSLFSPDWSGPSNTWKISASPRRTSSILPASRKNMIPNF